MVLNGKLTCLQLQQPGCRRGRPAGMCSVFECSGCEGDAAVWQYRAKAPRTRERAFIRVLLLFLLLDSCQMMVWASLQILTSDCSRATAGSVQAKCCCWAVCPREMAFQKKGWSGWCIGQLACSSRTMEGTCSPPRGERQQLSSVYLRLCRVPYQRPGRRTWPVHGTSCGPQNSKLQKEERDKKAVFRQGR